MAADLDRDHMLALLDADIDPDWEPNGWNPEDRPRCDASGPHGNCHRDAGHYDGAWAVRRHVTFDTGHYEEWPVGWRSEAERIAAIKDPSFASHMTGSEEYRRGVADAVALVRAVLT